MDQNRLLVVGALLLIAGAVLPFLMIIGILQSSFLLNFAAYGASIVGLFVGMIGIAMYVNDRDRDQY